MTVSGYLTTLNFYRNNIRTIKKKFDDQCAKIEQKAIEEIAQSDNNKTKIKKIIEQEQTALGKAAAEFEAVIRKNESEARRQIELLENQNNPTEELLEKEINTI